MGFTVAAYEGSKEMCEHTCILHNPRAAVKYARDRILALEQFAFDSVWANHLTVQVEFHSEGVNGRVLCFD